MRMLPLGTAGLRPCLTTTVPELNARAFRHLEILAPMQDFRIPTVCVDLDIRHFVQLRGQ